MDLADQALNLRNREANIEAEVKRLTPTGPTTKGASPKAGGVKDVMQIPTGLVGNAAEQRVKVGGKQPIQLNKDPNVTRNDKPQLVPQFDARNKDLSDIQYHTTNIEPQ